MTSHNERHPAGGGGASGAITGQHQRIDPQSTALGVTVPLECLPPAWPHCPISCLPRFCICAEMKR